ncbi:two-component system, OmpR family, sensor kinase [Noviherbaspirillum humi]|uniref:Signal transduction histidine-protein kinase/phosphatase MprB n=1 Tax=Noviherbaspirillum humi TaxID=1688639 RepID=A0A239HNN8_9BURK|nr:ATP-binding protein [Noviherbaspirillum humi]SNS82969.1 two-component system, OmpR family, sensor kinase [Noviherbaspirillum humi]
MGRLFWKFFILIWLAQLVSVLGISGAIWLKDRDAARHAEVIESGPRAGMALDAAEIALRYGGSDALRDLLQQQRREQMFALDADGRDLLGRPVDAALLASLRQTSGRDDRGGVRQLHGKDGSSWLVYLKRHEPPPGMRPGGPLLGDFRGPRPPGPGGPGPGPGPRFHYMPVLYAMLASLLAALLLARHFARPIRNLRTAFDAAASGNLEARIGPAMGRRRDELNDLGRDFDRMAAQLQASMNSQKRLLHDVSHELRSPLARLQVAIGLARQRPERVDASLDRIERESARMNALIGGLLTLSRLESGAGVEREEVSLNELAEVIAEDARFEAQSAGKDIRLEEAGQAMVRSGAELLHSALENVVRNAMHYTAPGTAVRIRVERDAAAGQACVTVCDHGPGVPEAELETIFRPFVQSSASSKSAEGFGLGLAIAERIVKAHGGAIRAANAAEGGLCITICLPLSAAAPA